MGRKLSTEFIKSEIIKRGYIPNFEEYTGNSQKLELSDGNGYKYLTTWISFKNSNPYTFHKSNPYTIDNIKLWLKLNNKPYKLLSTGYVNNTSLLNWKCPIHGEFPYSWMHIQAYTGCRECAIEESTKRMSTDWEDIERIIKENFGNSITILDNSTYEHLHSTIKVKCNVCDNIWTPEANNLKYNHGCEVCAKNKLSEMFRRDINDIINKVKLVLPYVDILDDFKNYKNGKTKILCYCNTHNLRFKQSVDLLLLGVSCEECGLDKKRGENNCNWNLNKTDEEREKQRNLCDENGMNQRLWSKEILKIHDYKCILCDNKLSSNLRAHHIKPYSIYKDERYLLENGVCMCEMCHDNKYQGSFHNIYGTKNCTEQDFYEYYRNIKGYEFKYNKTKGENENE